MPYDVAPDRLEVPLLPLKNVVVFPRTIVNLNIGHVRSLNAANLALAGDHYMVVTAVKSGESEDPSPADLYTTGTLVEVHAVRPQSENTAQVEVEALTSCRDPVDQRRRCLHDGRGRGFARKAGRGPRDHLANVPSSRVVQQVRRIEQ